MQILPQQPRPTIRLSDLSGDLIVADDDPEQREFLAEALRARGYVVREAEHGAEAFAACVQQPPDVALLDVMMPGMTGIDVCRRLKSHAPTAHIPVILITSLTEREDRLRGIDAGANDFLSKPVDLQDLQLRVRNSIQQKRLYDRLLEDNEKLLGIESLRDNLTHLVVHDMKTPLAGIDRSAAVLKTLLGGEGGPGAREALAVIQSASETLHQLRESLLDFNRFQMQVVNLQSESCDLADVAGRAAAIIRPTAEARLITITAPAGGVAVHADPSVIYRVLFVLIWNAVVHSPPGSPVEIAFSQSATGVTASIIDHGPAIPEGFQDQIFDILRQARLRGVGAGRSAGPGLAYVRLAVQAHGGSVGLASDAHATCFSITLPAVGAATL